MRMIAELMTQRERDSRAEYCVVSIHSRQHNVDRRRGRQEETRDLFARWRRCDANTFALAPRRSLGRRSVYVKDSLLLQGCEYRETDRAPEEHGDINKDIWQTRDCRGAGHAGACSA
jgi:hypothetical protein